MRGMRGQRQGRLAAEAFDHPGGGEGRSRHFSDLPGGDYPSSASLIKMRAARGAAWTACDAEGLAAASRADMACWLATGSQSVASREVKLAELGLDWNDAGSDYMTA